MITVEMIAKLADLHGVDADIAEGTLNLWAKGQGQIPKAIAEDEMFKPVVEAFYAAQGTSVPPVVHVDPVFGEGSTMVEAAPVEPVVEAPVPAPAE